MSNVNITLLYFVYLQMASAANVYSVAYRENKNSEKLLATFLIRIHWQCVFVSFSFNSRPLIVKQAARQIRMRVRIVRAQASARKTVVDNKKFDIN